MPYRNPYNEAIARQVHYNNVKFITHSDATGQGTIDYTQSANLSGGFLPALIPLNNLAVDHFFGKGLSGAGVGGVAEYKGANASKKHYYEDDSEYSTSDEEKEGGTRLGHASRYADKKQGDQFDQLQGGAILGLQSGTVIDGKKGKRVPKGKVNKVPAVSQSFGTLGVPADESKTREMVAMASIPAANARLGIASKPVGSAIEGGASGYAKGTFRDTGFGDVDGAVGAGKKKRGRPRKQSKKDKEDEKLAMEVKGVKDKEEIPKEAPKKRGRGRPRRDSGPDKLDLKLHRKKGGANPRMVGGTTTNTKETLQSTAKKELNAPVPKAQMPSSTMSGFGKGKGKRAELVKKIMKEKGLKLIEASKYVKEHNLY